MKGADISSSVQRNKGSITYVQNLHALQWAAMYYKELSCLNIWVGPCVSTTMCLCVIVVVCMHVLPVVYMVS